MQVWGGGNRKLWDGEVTAVENDDAIANQYSKLFPQDRLIIGDAHQYLLDHFDEYDFIWSSPPCQSHSKMVKATRHKLRKYPDLKLYEEIIFLQNFSGFRKWVVENVKPYYEPLVEPSFVLGRHLFWTNFNILPLVEISNFPNFINSGTVASSELIKKWLGIEYVGNIYYKGNHDPNQVLRNCVHPNIGKHTLESALR